jgi:hypothetical protein
VRAQWNGCFRFQSGISQIGRVFFLPEKAPAKKPRGGLSVRLGSGKRGDEKKARSNEQKKKGSAPVVHLTIAKELRN